MSSFYFSSHRQQNQILVSEGKVFCALLLSGKSAMRLIVVLKRKIQQDYEVNWLCAFVLFLLWHQCDNVMSVKGEKKKIIIIKPTYFWSSFILSCDVPMALNFVGENDLNKKCCQPAGLCFLHLPGCTCSAEAGEHLNSFRMTHAKKKNNKKTYLQACPAPHAA